MLDKIEHELARKGWTQSAFERAAMLSENRISKWKGGKGEPTAAQALAMARLLGVSLEYLVDDRQDEPGASDELSREIARIVQTIGPEAAYRRLLRADEFAGTESRPPMVLKPEVGRPGEGPASGKKGAG